MWQDVSNPQFKKIATFCMPVVLKIDLHRRVVNSSFYGKVTDQELLGHRSAIASDPHFNPNFSEIVDLTAVTDLEVSEATLAAMANTQSLFSDSVRHIIVAPADLAFHLASKYKLFSRDTRHNLLVVRNRSEAYRLLDILPD